MIFRLRNIVGKFCVRNITEIFIGTFEPKLTIQASIILKVVDPTGFTLEAHECSHQGRLDNFNFFLRRSVNLQYKNAFRCFAMGKPSKELISFQVNKQKRRKTGKQLNVAMDSFTKHVF